MDDPYDDGTTFRGWADRVADRLATETEGFRYANLAVRGRLLTQIVTQQVPTAVEMRPALVSLTGGTNDALRRGFDPSVATAALRDGVRRLRDAGCDVLLFTGTDPTYRLPRARPLLPRFQVLNDASRELAREYGCLLADLWPARDVFDLAEMWSDDRLHLSTAGHEAVTAVVLQTLGVPVEAALRPDGRRPAPLGRWAAVAADLRWLRSYAGPWVHRRLTGRSSGDAIEPKRPNLTPLR